jgi:iron complex outermembrane receptor protein
MNRFNKASLLAGTIIAGAVIATPAYAQDAETEVATTTRDDNFIVVTGSRIQQRNVETAAPVAVVAAEEFKLSGAVNVENVLNTLPQVIPGTTAFSNNPGTGAVTLNLRGLGSTRTLVLVNGRRWVSFDTNQVVDLNTIPNFLIESVDVVTGGASAVYGSDALAGVVNFRLKKVEGLEMGGQYSLTERGDGARYQLYGAIGTSFDDGRGSATVYGEYFNRQAVFQGDRGFSEFAIGGETFGVPLQQFGSGALPVARIIAPANVAIAPNPGNPTDNPENFANLATGSVLRDGLFRQRGIATPTAGDTYNYAPVNYLQIPQERYLFGGYADYEFTTGHRAYTEVTYVNNRVAQELAATPITGTTNVNIAAVSQFLDPSALAAFNQLDANQQAADAQRVANGLAPLFTPGVIRANVLRRTTETGPRNSLDERNAFRILAGVTGGITDNINYDAYYSFARTRNANVQQGNISRSAFNRGLDGTDPAINIFGPDTLTPEMVQQISIQAQNGDISSTEVAAASVNGFLGNLGMGAQDIGFAVGAEYRRVAAQFIPDTALSSGDVVGFNAGEATEGAYDVKEIFAELIVPIIETDGGLSLTVNGAARYSDYSLENVGGVWTYAGGVQFRPFADMMLRGQYQRAVRAPNVQELFGGTAIGFPGATDPCSSAAFLSSNPGSSAICTAHGVPAGNLGGGQAVQLNAQIPALFGGNPNLGEETSTSWTAGVVLQPSFLPGLTITADYFNIEVEDFITIAGGGLQGLLNLCYSGGDANSLLCQPFIGIRDADGRIDVGAPPLVAGINAANLETSGVDLQVNYRTNLPFSLLTDSGSSRFDLNFNGTWTDKYDFTPVVGRDAVDQCAGRFGGNCGQPISSFKWASRLTWIDGPLTTSVRWRHLSAVDDADDEVNFADFNGIERIGAYDLFDLTFSFDVTEKVTFSLGVNNIFDTLPGTPTFNGIQVGNRPNSLLLGDNQEQANTFPSVYDVLGRDFFASIAFSF